MLSVSRFMFIPLYRFTLFFFAHFVHPTSQNVFCSYVMSPFLLIEWFQQKQKFPPPSTLTPSPIIQVQQSRLSQAAGDRGIAEGSWYLLGVRDLWFWIFLCDMYVNFRMLCFFMIFWIIFVRLLLDGLGGPTHYIRSGWCKAIVKGWQSAWLCVGVPGDVMSTKIDPLRLHPQHFQMCNVHLYGFGWMFSSANRFTKVCLCRYLEDHSIVSG